MIIAIMIANNDKKTAPIIFQMKTSQNTISSSYYVFYFITFNQVTSDNRNKTLIPKSFNDIKGIANIMVMCLEYIYLIF